LTNAFSKKLANPAAAFALYMMYYNFARVHQTLRVTRDGGKGQRSCLEHRGNGGTIGAERTFGEGIMNNFLGLRPMEITFLAMVVGFILAVRSIGRMSR
jgi:hypothetical protein